MGLILGIIIFAAAHLWILKKLDEWEPCPYDTTYCRDVRATDGRLVGALDLEETRAKIDGKSSKF